MFGLFNKKTTTLSDKLADKLSKQSISWEIHVNYNLDAKIESFHIITGQKPLTFEELQDFHRLFSHNGNKKNAKKQTYLDTSIFTSKLFEDFSRSLTGSTRTEVNPQEFMRYIIVELSGVQKSLLDRDYYFSDHERYKADDLMVYWSFLDEIGFLEEGALPLSFIRLHSHATSKSYHSLCFENMTVDTLDDIYDNKQKGV